MNSLKTGLPAVHLRGLVGVIAAVGLALLACAGCGDDATNSDPDSGAQHDAGTTCGNGTVEGLEECDDGTDNSDTRADACRTNCLLAHCGDGVADGPEACDDGSQNSDEVPNACRLDCVAPTCGDGVVDVAVGEECDEGIAQPTPECSASCLVIFCGNGILDVGEVCDDGNNASGDGCSAECASLEICGNGHVDVATDEQCDDEGESAGCNDDCTAALCGDGKVNVSAAEACDDGGESSLCNFDCTDASCGDGVLNLTAGEQCDDANTTPGDGCQADCLLPRCGDGVIDAMLFEECDNGTANSDLDADACRTTCRLPRCGDTVTDTGEVCDDGDLSSGDGCAGDCLSDERCGNGILDAAAGEQCDDGNHRNHDGCTSACRLETPLWQPWDGSTLRRMGHHLDYDVARDRLVLFGGVNEEGQLADTWEYDGAAWRLRDTATSPAARAFGQMVYDAAAGVMVLFGGQTTGGGAPLGDTWTYDGTDWTEITTPTAPTQRLLAAMAYDAGRDRVVLFGGRTNPPTWTLLNDTWEFDGAAWTQAAPTVNPATRVNAAMDYMSNRGTIVLFGGADAADVPYDETWEYDGTTWSPISGSAPAGRSRHDVAYHAGDQSLLLFGGMQAGGVPPAWSAEFNGVWSLSPGGPSRRINHRMAYDGLRDQILLFGGVTTSSYTDDLWSHDGTQWTELPQDVQAEPPERRDAAMACDPTRGRAVLVGGYGSSSPGGTWEFDGDYWYETDDATAPADRQGHAMAFMDDGSGGRVVLFGGSSSTGYDQGTWLYADGVWTRETHAVSPPPRRLHSMTYDAERNRVVLFGGITEDGTVLGDTWEFDGTDWVERSVGSAPPVRFAAGLVWDSARRRAVLFGGVESGWIYRQDTWEFDGTSWVQAQPVHRPTARRTPSMSYDVFRGRVILFGGLIGPNSFKRDTWEFDGVDWTEITSLSPVAPTARQTAMLCYDVQRKVTVLYGGLPLNAETWELQYLNIGQVDETCDNASDDDSDGLTDCDDPDCNRSPSCPNPEQCGSGVDEDADGLTDCADPNCGGAPCPGGTCIDLVCQ